MPRKLRRTLLFVALLAAIRCNLILNVEEKHFDARDAGADDSRAGADGNPDGTAIQHDGLWPCQPKTCDELGAECDAIDNGCGQPIGCGACTAPNSCGAIVANHCGCKPTTCAAEGKNCDTIDDHCGKSLDCGTCAPPAVCGGTKIDHVCGVPPCSTTYQNGFESSADFVVDNTDPLKWYVYTPACGTGSTVERGTWPAPNGGNYGLRLSTVAFGTTCGVYAMSPTFKANPNVTIRLEMYLETTGTTGETFLLFYDQSGKQISVSGAVVPWPQKSFPYGADPLVLRYLSPSTTASIRFRLDLTSPSANADVDLIKVCEEQPI